MVLPGSSLRRRCLTGPQRKSSLTRELGVGKRTFETQGISCTRCRGRNEIEGGRKGRNRKESDAAKAQTKWPEVGRGGREAGL